MAPYNNTSAVVALFPSNSELVWNAETPAVNTASRQVALARSPSMVGPIPLAFDLQFSAAPGSFEIDLQTADQDAEAFYITLASGGSITTVDAAKFTARVEIPAGVVANFARLFVKTAIQNAVTLKAHITRG